MSSQLRARASKRTARARRTASSRPVKLGLSHLGYAIKGIVYIVISLVAILVATGHGELGTDQKGALRAVYHSPLGENLGRLLLFIIVVGAFALILWNIVRALFDTERHGNDSRGIVQRVGYIVVAIGYAMLGIVTYSIATTSAALPSDSARQAQNWTGRLLQQPVGALLIILFGILVLCFAFSMFHRAYHMTFASHLALDNRNRGRLLLAGRLGYTIIGIVLSIVGFFLVIAGAQHNPGDPKGLDVTLVELLKQPAGPWLLGFIALALVVYGCYSFLEARYHSVEVNEKNRDVTRAP